MNYLKLTLLSLGYILVISACGNSQSTDVNAGNYKSGNCGNNVIADYSSLLRSCNTIGNRNESVKYSKDEMETCRNLSETKTESLVEKYPNINCTMINERTNRVMPITEESFILVPKVLMAVLVLHNANIEKKIAAQAERSKKHKHEES